MGKVIEYNEQKYRVLNINVLMNTHSLIEIWDDSSKFNRIIHVSSDIVIPLMNKTEHNSKTHKHEPEER